MYGWGVNELVIEDKLALFKNRCKLIKTIHFG
jgi:hypothetical protein